MFLMDIALSDDDDRLLRDLDMLKDDALEAADEAVRAPDPACPTCAMPCIGKQQTEPSKLSLL